MAVLNLKKVIAKKQKHNSKLSHLPNHLISEILARVASTSFTDLFNAKTTCKLLLEAGSEDYVFTHISIDTLPIISWEKNGATGFLERCLSCENPESLFRQGMIEYFSNSNRDCGIEYLRRASDKGHVAAKYVCAIIFVCYGGELRRQQGLKLVADSEKSDLNRVVKQCRKKVKKVVRSMWVRNYMIENIGAVFEEFKVKRRNCSCRDKINWRRKKSIEWTNFEEFNDGVSCESCLWDIEAVRFCNMLRTGRFTCPFV